MRLLELSFVEHGIQKDSKWQRWRLRVARRVLDDAAVEMRVPGGVAHRAKQLFVRM